MSVCVIKLLLIAVTSKFEPCTLSEVTTHNKFIVFVVVIVIYSPLSSRSLIFSFPKLCLLLLLLVVWCAIIGQENIVGSHSFIQFPANLGYLSWSTSTSGHCPMNVSHKK